MTALVWLRNDLRLRDNPALYKAAELGQGVIALYVHCEAYVERFPIAPIRLDFIRRHLQLLAQELAGLRISLQVLQVSDAADIAPALTQFARENAISHCFFNAEYPLDELVRDQQVNSLLRESGILVKRCHDRVIIPPGMLRTGKGEPYKVFTPFKRKWLSMAMALRLQPLGLPAAQQAMALVPASAAAIDALFAKHLADKNQADKNQADKTRAQHWQQLWPAGEAAALGYLADFIAEGLNSYHTQRDFPALAGTSRLSPYLALGTLSPRQALAAVLADSEGDWEANEGASCWINELIWREFYQHLVVDFAEVCKHRPMQANTEYFPWRRDEAALARWCAGNTGIPIIDAAMRQLAATGWMHNRLRMLVAMYLCKNLQIDWRLGERYFMQQLIDGDFAANNGGWQWSASTGTDAAPYFRIFNPVTQSQRYDPEGTFIRAWVPELAALGNKEIHNPYGSKLTAAQLAELGYPPPQVDLGQSRKETIALFSRLPVL